MHSNRLMLVVWLLTIGSVLVPVGPSGQAADWPGWQGPNHDRKSGDTGLLKEWPEGGPKLAWKLDAVGEGFGSMAVVADRIYTSGVVDGQLNVFAFNVDGQLQWKSQFDSPAKKSPPGSRATPTIDGGRLYLLSGNGVVGCFDAQTGQRQWTRSATEFNGISGGWGYAESVLIYKDLAIFKAGGKSCIVALNKATGETVWTSSGFEAGPEYGSCLPITFQNREMIVTGTNAGIVGVDSQDGKLLWQNDFAARNTANCPTPAYADGYVFWANGYGRGGVCLKLRSDGETVNADLAWTTKDMDCHHGGYVIHEGYIYGNDGATWTCLELTSGERQWKERAVGKGSLCFAEGMLYLFSEKGGEAGLATCSPLGLELKGQVKVEGSGPSWAHPVVAGGKLYLRYAKYLYCFDVKGS